MKNVRNSTHSNFPTIDGVVVRSVGTRNTVISETPRVADRPSGPATTSKIFDEKFKEESDIGGGTTTYLSGVISTCQMSD